MQFKSQKIVHDLSGQFMSPPREMTMSAKLLVQNINRTVCCVAPSAVLLKPHVDQIHILDFRPKKQICWYSISSKMRLVAEDFVCQNRRQLSTGLMPSP